MYNIKWRSCCFSTSVDVDVEFTKNQPSMVLKHCVLVYPHLWNASKWFNCTTCLLLSYNKTYSCISANVYRCLV